MMEKMNFDGVKSFFEKLSNYIYCTVCDFLVFLSDARGYSYADKHLKRCITRYGSVSGIDECANREECLKMIARKKEALWSSMSSILTIEAEIRCILRKGSSGISVL